LSFLRYVNDAFRDNVIATIGIGDFKYKSIQIDDSIVKLQIWDTAGSYRFRTITNKFYQITKGVLLLYDVSDAGSFESVRNWMINIDQYAAENVNRILIGNKCDVDPSKRVCFLFF
jgi:small GTP-binding protein